MQNCIGVTLLFFWCLRLVASGVDRTEAWERASTYQASPPPSTQSPVPGSLSQRRNRGPAPLLWRLGRSQTSPDTFAPTKLVGPSERPSTGYRPKRSLPYSRLDGCGLPGPPGSRPAPCHPRDRPPAIQCPPGEPSSSVEPLISHILRRSLPYPRPDACGPPGPPGSRPVPCPPGGPPPPIGPPTGHRPRRSLPYPRLDACGPPGPPGSRPAPCLPGGPPPPIGPPTGHRLK